MGVYARVAGVMELERGGIGGFIEKIGLYEYETVGCVIMNMK